MLKCYHIPTDAAIVHIYVTLFKRFEGNSPFFEDHSVCNISLCSMSSTIVYSLIIFLHLIEREREREREMIKFYDDMQNLSKLILYIVILNVGVKLQRGY